MKKLAKALGVVGLAAIVASCAPTKDPESGEGDYIKILDVKLRPIIYMQEMPKNRPDRMLEVKIDGYDEDGWRYITFFMDGKPVYTKKPVNFPIPGLTSCDEFKDVPKGYLNLVRLTPDYGSKDQKHIIGAILYDCEGNTVDDTFIFKFDNSSE